jgi:hypothetical protein
MTKDRTRPGPPGSDEGDAHGSPGALPEMVRRMMALGLSGFFTTEETLRRALGDTIPQDWIDFAAGQSEKTRRDFSEAVARELGRVLEGVDLAELFGRVLESRTVEIRAQVRLLPEDPDRDGPRTRFERLTVDFEDPGET